LINSYRRNPANKSNQNTSAKWVIFSYLQIEEIKLFLTEPIEKQLAIYISLSGNLNLLPKAFLLIFFPVSTQN
jgi:hypothetical protein